MTRFTCQQCRQRVRGTPRRTVTGRELCVVCHDRLTGLAAGMLASGGDVGQSIATSSIYSRLRAWRRRRGRSDEDDA